MDLWTASVDCWRETDGKRMFETRRFLFEALDSMDAFNLAAQHAETTARFGEKWIDFHVRSVARASLPFEVKAGAS